MVFHDRHVNWDVGRVDAYNQFHVLYCSFVWGPVTSCGDTLVKERCDPVECFLWVDQSEGFSFAQELLLVPFVGLPEMAVNGFVNRLTKKVERRLRNGLEEVVQREVQGMCDD